MLDALGASPRDLGTNEIARQTGINASTVSRLLATLVAAGYVEHLDDSGRYRLGGRVLQLGQAVLARLDLRGVARPLLERLVAATGETATLSLPAGGEAITADFAASPAAVISVARVGRPSVSHATAVGKAMLAFGDHGLGALPDGALERFTARTIVDRDALAADRDRTRARGFARAEREREPDLNALAAPVRDGRGRLAAILGVQGPAERFCGDALETAVAPLLSAADAVSAAVSGRLS